MSVTSPHVHFDDATGMVCVKGDFLQNAREVNSSLKYNFGVLRITSNQEIPITKRLVPSHFIFNVDVSGSMAVNIQHIKDVLTKCVDYVLSKKDMMEAYLTINLFNSTVEEYIVAREINEESMGEIKDKISKISTLGTTNFEEPLSIIHHQHSMLKQSLNITHMEGYHIFLTDGSPNRGMYEPSKLVYHNKNKDEIHHYFIGLGDQIQADYLYNLNGLFHGEFFTMDSEEAIQYTYGDAMNHIMSSDVSHLKLCSNNKYFQFYNEVTNTWDYTYDCGRFCRNMDKPVHVRVPWDDTVTEYEISYQYAVVNGKAPDAIEIRSSYMVYNSSEETTESSRNTELTPYYYRQKVLEAQYHILFAKKTSDEMKTIHYSFEDNPINISILHDELSTAYDESYPRIQLLRTLIDDIELLRNLLDKRGELVDLPACVPSLLGPDTTSVGIPLSLNREYSVGLSRHSSQTRQHGTMAPYTPDPLVYSGISSHPRRARQLGNNNSTSASSMNNDPSHYMSPYASAQTQNELNNFM